MQNFGSDKIAENWKGIGNNRRQLPAAGEIASLEVWTGLTRLIQGRFVKVWKGIFQNQKFMQKKTKVEANCLPLSFLETLLSCHQWHKCNPKWSILHVSLAKRAGWSYSRSKSWWPVLVLLMSTSAKPAGHTSPCSFGWAQSHQGCKISILRNDIVIWVERDL